MITAHRCNGRRSSGLTLIEVMVALAIGGMLAAAVALVVSNLSEASRAVDAYAKAARGDDIVHRMLTADVGAMTLRLPRREEKRKRTSGEPKRQALKDLTAFEADHLVFPVVSTGAAGRPVVLVVEYRFTRAGTAGTLTRTEEPADGWADGMRLASRRLTLARDLAGVTFAYFDGRTWRDSLPEDVYPVAVRWQYGRRRHRPDEAAEPVTVDRQGAAIVLARPTLEDES